MQLKTGGIRTFRFIQIPGSHPDEHTANIYVLGSTWGWTSVPQDFSYFAAEAT